MARNDTGIRVNEQANRLQQEIDRRKRAEEQLRFLASELSLAEERERRRIAAVLHDLIGQTLAVCKIRLGTLRESVLSTDLAIHIDEVRELVDQVIQDTRSLTSELSPYILYELGLEAAVESLAKQIQEQYSILPNFEDDGQPKPLDDGVRVVLFQAVRELLVNAAKHAQVHSVKVSISRRDGNIRISVEDNGVGFDASDISLRVCRSNGFGLFNIRERLRHLGGSLEVRSELGHGTMVVLTAPLKSEKENTIEA